MKDRDNQNFPKSTKEEIKRGKTHMMVGDDKGQVFIRFPQPMQAVVLDPQNAFQIAEGLARAAHKARFGEDPPSDASYLGQQVKTRITDELRDAKIARVTVMLNNMQTNPKTPGYWAMQIVDSMLSGIA